ncbi:MAG: hypothetical protein ACLPN2_10320 [Terriglobales bacterium]
MTNPTRGRKKVATRALIPIIGFLCLIGWVGAPVAAAEHEDLNFQLDLGWKKANDAERRGYVIIEWVREGDDINNWKELFTYQNFGLHGERTPDDFLNNLKALREKECPGVTEWNVIEHNENSILYEWRVKPCMSWPDQHEIARIIFGKHNLFLLRYTAKVKELAPDTRTKWINMLKAATVEAKSVGAEDVDEVVPFEMDKLMVALKAAMESADCNVKEATDNRVECKRPRHTSGNRVYGGESVTAVLEAQGNKTRVVITTGKGFYGRLVKSNRSIPIFQQMIKNLEKPQP